MATKELPDDNREEFLQLGREQISAGDLVVGELTASQRRIWDDRAASFDEHSDPGERSRREAARQERMGKANAEEPAPNASLPR